MHGGEKLGGVIEFRERLTPGKLVLHLGQGVDQTADTGDGLTDSAAQLADVVGQGVGTVGQPVEVTSVAGDQGGGVGRVMPRTAAIPGNWLTRRAICSRSARPCGVRKSCGDWTKRY